jgi:hypothetical protein
MRNSMTPLDPVLFGRAIAAKVKSYLAPLEQRVASLEQRPLPERGEKGLTGPQGERGEKGERGADGRDGIIGKDGAIGLRGEVGPQGPAGERGMDGKDGAVGARGDVGPQGPAGEKGERGAVGLAGKDGAMGPMGPAGPQGETGPSGRDGEKGERGEKGDPGIVPQDVLDAFQRAIAGLEAKVSRTDDLDADVLAAQFTDALRKELPMMPPQPVWRTQKRVIRDEQGKVARIVDEPLI